MSVAARTEMSPLRHIPNAITLLRMVAAVPLAWSIGAGDYAGALAWAFAAGASDALDGLLAKRFGWQSELGGRIDPIADKLLLLAATLALVVAGDLPCWWLALSVGRDMVIVAGAVTYHRLIGPLVTQPSPLSKLTTVLQVALVLVVLAGAIVGGDAIAFAIRLLLWLASAATVGSGVHYVVTWSRRAGREWPHRIGQ